MFKCKKSERRRLLFSGCIRDASGTGFAGYEIGTINGGSHGT